MSIREEELLTMAHDANITMAALAALRPLSGEFCTSWTASGPLVKTTYEQRSGEERTCIVMQQERKWTVQLNATTGRAPKVEGEHHVTGADLPRYHLIEESDLELEYRTDARRVDAWREML